MHSEVKYYLDNKSFEGIQLGKPFLFKLMKWAHMNTFRYDEGKIKESLDIFKKVFENKNLANCSLNLKQDFLKEMESKFGYCENDILDMINTFDNYFIKCEDSSNTKFIAIEGIDGSGKTEQTNLLKNLLEDEKYKVLVLSFPVYESFFGKEIGYLLSGEGKIDANTVDSKSMSLWYALDRYSTIKNINFSDYDYIIFNRYTLSSAVYQSVRDNNDDIADWIFNLENHELNLPIPDLYLILDVNVNQSHSNVSKKGERSYLEGEKDVYEKSDSLLGNARKKYLTICNQYMNMDVVNCNDEEGKLKGIKSIHEVIKEKLYQWNLLNINKN